MIFSGKTFEEAMKKAESETGRSRDELIYVKIEQKKGIFRGAEVSIHVQGFKSFGSVEIRSGSVVVKNGDILPTIEAGEHVNLVVNGKEVKGTIQVSENDDIMVSASKVEAERSISLRISDDKMEASADVAYVPQRDYILKDIHPNKHVRVEAEMINEVFPPFFTREEFENILKEHNIKYGIRWDVISQILKGGSGIVAKGLKPTDPIDDKIEYYFNDKIEKKPVEIEGKVDYYNIGEIDFVEKNQLLALRFEGKDGEAGFDVHGNRIPSRKRMNLKLSKGPGCEILDNGNRVISIERGLPSIKASRICVFPAHVIEGDVDLKTGNISFDGDIVVKGNVHEGLKVTAGNNIRIIGNIENCKITSGGSTEIGKSIIGAEIYAGSSQICDQESIEHLRVIEEFLHNLRNSLRIIQESKQFSVNHSIGHIVKVLMESKYKGYKSKIVDGYNFVKTNKVDEKIKNLWIQFLDIYREMLLGNLGDIDILQNIESICLSLLDEFEVRLSPADVIVNYSQNSEIYATRDIEVRGKGCYNTSLKADGEVRFTGTPGIFRGGQITAGHRIHLKECGSQAGVRGDLVTTKSGVIEIDRAYQNTILHFDELIYRIDYPVKNLKAYVSKGEIVVEKLKL